MDDCTDDTLGRLVSVPLRDIWPEEARGFTPWLAKPNNLSILAETLGIEELEVKSVEERVGSFCADILCKDISDDTHILIENQLEKTDHKHLGQLLTYAGGLQVPTIVWVAESFTDEHRAALDWLNKITDDRFHFFGLIIQLLKIDDSRPAPNFEIVSKPNDWSKSIAKKTRETELTETGKMQVDYWKALNLELKEVGGSISKGRKPWPRSWIDYSVGRRGFALRAAMERSRKRISSELYIYNTDTEADTFFHLLEQQKDEIEQKFGFSLEWEIKPQHQHCRVAIYLADVDPDDKLDWKRQHQWLVKNLNQMYDVFSLRIKELNAEDFQPEDGAGFNL